MTARIFRGSAKYAAWSWFSLRELRAAPAELYGTALFFATILLVFSSLWRKAAEVGLPLGLGSAELVWYLAATEWLLMSTPNVHLDMAEEIRRGDVAYALLRPVSYLSAHCARALGQLILRLVLLAPVAFGLAALFAQALPARPAALLQLAGYGFGACCMATLFRIALGLTAFWLHDISPLHWIWQKLSFLLGGLMLPLPFLPEALQRFAAFTPFPNMLYVPASVLTGAQPSVTRVLAAQLLWSSLALVTSVWLFSRARRALELNGG